jgi:predicted nucleic acid-binding protein
VIIDASAFVAALGTHASTNSLDTSDLSAPDLIVPETLNAFWRLSRAGMAVPERMVVLEFLDRIRIQPSRPYAPRAAELAEEFDHPVYDCFYLAVAEAEDDNLFTADARLARKLGKSRLRKRIRLF